MSRDPRKVSRTLEDRSIIGSMTRVTQIAQADNELKQKLESIEQFYKLSNKRINNETRELKQILHGLQHELRVSKADTQYVPSLYEMPSIRSRRKTVSSVPSEDRKQTISEGDVWRNTPHRPSHNYVKDRRRSTSYPSVSHAQEVKKQTELSEEGGGVDLLTLDENFQHSRLRQDRDVVKEIEGQRKTSQAMQLSFDTQENETGICVQHEAELLWNAHGNRCVNQLDCKLKLPEKGFPKEQQLTGRRKRSTVERESHFADAVRGSFIASRETPYEDDAVVSQPKNNPPGRFPLGNLNVSRRSRGNVAEQNPSTPYQCSQRKPSLGIPQKHAQRKGRQSPATIPQWRLQEEPASDSPPEQFGGRMKGVVHGRARRGSRVSGLPPLKEERLTPRQEQEKPFESWSDLAQCRYLRKEEKELGIDDIFGKK